MRPVRPADRDRVVELTRDVWGGHDYLPEVFDDWVADAASAFEALEVDGVVVGLQRLRPYAPGLVWYEGLRVASSHRRQGLARAMLTSAIAEAKEQGHREMRLATGNVDAVPLFESVGFERLVDVRWWRGSRVEGGESARIPGAAEAEKLWPGIARSPGIELYHGVVADFTGRATWAQLSWRGWPRTACCAWVRAAAPWPVYGDLGETTSRSASSPAPGARCATCSWRCVSRPTPMGWTTWS
jgi:GNAT superfamily N-acetyltransferase